MEEKVENWEMLESLMRGAEIEKEEENKLTKGGGGLLSKIKVWKMPKNSQE